MHKKILIQIVVLVYVAATLAFLGSVAYLGTFTRYLADDYCESVSVTNESPLKAVIHRYMDGQWRASNRYSNLLFVGVAESLLGKQNIEIVPVVLIFFWVIGLGYLVRQARKLAEIEWNTLTDIFLGTTLAFLSILEAPNRFQIFYWRSSMATHFVPLVFLNFLVAFLLSRMRTERESSLDLWTALTLFFSSFMIGGFSEPPVTVLITATGLGLASIWFFVREREVRRTFLSLTACIFAGAISALIVMAISPAASNLARVTPSFFEWIYRTAQYTVSFVIDTFNILPLPILFSVICPAVLVFIIYREQGKLYIYNKQTHRNIALALPLILILLIAAGFSTSAYGQSYPVARARFFAHYLMTITFVIEGLLLGIWLSQIKSKFFLKMDFAYMPILFLLILAVYPFRAALRVLNEIPSYSAREQAWDSREADIYKLRAQGQTDLTIIQLDGVDGVKELDTYASHWVNLCAASYYKVKSIRAISPK